MSGKLSFSDWKSQGTLLEKSYRNPVFTKIQYASTNAGRISVYRLVLFFFDLYQFVDQSASFHIRYICGLVA